MRLGDEIPVAGAIRGLVGRNLGRGRGKLDAEVRKETSEERAGSGDAEVRKETSEERAESGDAEVRKETSEERAGTGA